MEKIEVTEEMVDRALAAHVKSTGNNYAEWISMKRAIEAAINPPQEPHQFTKEEMEGFLLARIKHHCDGGLKHWFFMDELPRAVSDFVEKFYAGATKKPQPPETEWSLERAPGIHRRNLDPPDSSTLHRRKGDRK